MVDIMRYGFQPPEATGRENESLSTMKKLPVQSRCKTKNGSDSQNRRIPSPYQQRHVFQMSTNELSSSDSSGSGDRCRVDNRYSLVLLEGIGKVP